MSRVIIEGVTYYSPMWDNEECSKIATSLRDLSNWEYKKISMMGRQCAQGRKTAFFAIDPEFEYHYSGTKTRGEIMPTWMLDIKTIVESSLGNEFEFNYCLCNWYKDGTESISMHSDDIRDLKGPIASVSFGAVRRFDFMNKVTKEKVLTNLESGCMVVMTKESQKDWKHGVPKQLKIKTERFNLTFRVV
jgi:alkylated DNA repair dioxygenase AlkB